MQTLCHYANRVRHMPPNPWVVGAAFAAGMLGLPLVIARCL